MKHSIKTLRKNHRQFFEDQLENCTKLKIVSPFITSNISERILNRIDGKKIKLITRYDLRDFYSGVSDLAALSRFKKNKSQIRGVYRLHSKLYIFDERSAIITSANFTSGGMMSNMEFGLLVNDKKIVLECIDYFNFLWSRSKNSLTISKLNGWHKKINKLKKAKKEEKSNLGLKDEGNNCFDNNEVENDLETSKSLNKTEIKEKYFYSNKRFFVKYIGATDGRVSLDTSIKEVIEESLSHEAVFYSFHPRQISNYDVIYFGRMTENPADYAIYGKAIGQKHYDQLHTINSKTKTKKWQKEYPYYNLIKEPIFQDGTLFNCVLLRNHMIKRFKSDTLISTQQRKKIGEKNITVSKSLMQKQFVEITPKAAKWLDAQLEIRLKKNGSVSNKFLNNLSRSL